MATRRENSRTPSFDTYLPPDTWLVVLAMRCARLSLTRRASDGAEAVPYCCAVAGGGARVLGCGLKHHSKATVDPAPAADRATFRSHDRSPKGTDAARSSWKSAATSAASAA
jgi:hypothetical protein